MTQELRLNPVELRTVARNVEATALAALDTYTDISFASVVGDAQRFPRPAPEDRAAQQGFAAMHRDVEGVVATLYAVAAAVERDLPVPSILLVSVLPYIEVFHQALEREEIIDEEEFERDDGTDLNLDDEKPEVPEEGAAMDDSSPSGDELSQ